MTIAYVITTINPPTSGVAAIAEGAQAQGDTVVVVGDTKTPSGWGHPGVTFLSYDHQRTLPFATAQAVPRKSYTRKLVGYLHAFTNGASWVRETDDDNVPYPSFFAIPEETLVCREPVPQENWVNSFAYFTDRFVWPRGFPLRLIQSSLLATPLSGQTSEVKGLIVTQGLADGDPDVDAIYRLTAPDLSDITFRQELPLVLPEGSWTPFNTQVTTWPRELLPLMYLPSTCSFRMTDIWRSFLVQRLLPGLGASLVITSPTVHQDRNEHDLTRDFADEIEGYTGYEAFVQVLNETSTTGGFPHLLDDLRGLYVALCAAGFFSTDELTILDAWIADVRSLGFGEAA